MHNIEKMKKTLITLLAVFVAGFLFAQTAANKPLSGGKIVLGKGQKIVIENTVSIESSMSPGVEASNNTASENILEVKDVTDKGYTISNSLSKLKLSMDIMGQSSSYDSEKPADQNTDMGKSLAKQLNNPMDVSLDNTTGHALAINKPKVEKETDDANPMQGLLQMLGDNGSDEAVVSGAFQLIPAGKNIGDTWSDSTIDKDMKTRRSYTLKSISDSGAVILLSSITESVNNIEMQGMQIEITSSTQTNTKMLTNIATGQLMKKTTQATISGSFQVMGQSVPISAKASTVSIYK